MEKVAMDESRRTAVSMPSLDPGDLTIERIEVIPLRVPLSRKFQGSYYSMTSRCTIITRVYFSSGLVGEAYNGDT
ncbi:MAG TPA: hypothetical protein VK020_02210, partial [Microlunatus sp.]|nr:hypothetical protein [Microlunatus sp.]